MHKDGYPQMLGSGYKNTKRGNFSLGHSMFKLKIIRLFCSSRIVVEF